MILRFMVIFWVIVLFALWKSGSGGPELQRIYAILSIFMVGDVLRDEIRKGRSA